MTTGARFSDCGKYRYQLWRIWDESKPLVQLIGLNPSTANAETNDNTITRIEGLVAANGYGGFYMTNLFAWISKNPEDLDNVPDKFGENPFYLAATRAICDDVIFCWGNFKQAKHYAKNVIASFKGAKCFKKTKDGSPWHPLYLKSNTKVIDYET